MEPPAERIFGSREQLIKAAREHAIQRGYVVTIVRSTAQKNVYLGCDRGGFYHDRVNAPEGAKRRLTNTRRINCPFMLFGRRVSGDRWELKVKNPCHNHSTENTMIGHPSARRLTEEQLNEVLRLSEIGLAPRDVLAVTRKQYPEALVSSRDIYNARSALRRQKLGNSTPLEYLQKTLQENSWKYAFKQDAEGRVLFFIFAHPESIRYANKYNRVFVLDCTYKTNRYRMPLLHIIGVSPSNSTFSIAFCFMQNEQEESYTWALRAFFSFLDPLPFQPVLCTDRDLALLAAIETICPAYPHLLCIWHINKNVTANIKQYFSKGDDYEEFIQLWNQLIHSATEDEYNKRLSEIEGKYGIVPCALRYIKETWLIFKEKFIVAWTRQHLHLGNSATSRVEGSHSFLKKHIGAASGDMLVVFERITHALQTQHNTLELDFKRDQIERPVISSHGLYANIVTRTSRYSIQLISKQAARAKRATSFAPLEPCTNVFAGIMGLPCAHRIAVLLENNEAISITEIHPFWRTGLNEQMLTYLPLLEPLVPLPKSNKRKSPFPVKGDAEMRDPSLFELPNAENTANETVSTRRKAPPKCSTCGRVGHTRRTCRE
jgi:hypothetical protein